ncbi:hypothetical protein EUGRSUZ_G02695 [Eucalyptus grandis]|uniref:Uncharacterized protein n=2 Tax=Eucalyptus grandis TaxID=71139 RepID=A0ACC3K6N5_EUCGR|nr:hypothetical protein EUGRSUZ_G02695 [Eucalyptus grandis]
MDEANHKLFLENCAIIQENERLRKKAEELAQENQALLQELTQKLSKSEHADPEHGSSSSTVNQPRKNINNNNDDNKK